MKNGLPGAAPHVLGFPGEMEKLWNMFHYFSDSSGRPDGPHLAPTHGQALVQGRQVSALGPSRGMGHLGQAGAQRAMTLAGLPRALLPRTLIVSRGHAGPG